MLPMNIHSATSSSFAHRCSPQQTPLFQLRKSHHSPCVAMAKPTKAAEFRDLTDEDIESQILSCKKALWNVKLAQAKREAFKQDQFKWNKNKIAQLKTVQREREIEKGIDKRESRKLAKEREEHWQITSPAKLSLE